MHAENYEKGCDILKISSSCAFIPLACGDGISDEGQRSTWVKRDEDGGSDGDDRANRGCWGVPYGHGRRGPRGSKGFSRVCEHVL
jgi:hypothetical protein